MKHKKEFIWFLAVVVLLTVAASGTLYRGRFVGLGTVPHFIGNGAGLTNLSGGGTFTQVVTFNTNVVFNGKVTFNSNVVVNVLTYNTNAWAGPTNSLILGTNHLNYIAAGDCNITNVAGQDSALNTSSTLTISNSTASAITARITASGVRLQGTSTTTALSIGSGKEGIITILCRGVLSTNMVNTTQQ